MKWGPPQTTRISSEEGDSPKKPCAVTMGKGTGTGHRRGLTPSDLRVGGD